MDTLRPADALPDLAVPQSTLGERLSGRLGSAARFFRPRSAKVQPPLRSSVPAESGAAPGSLWTEASKPLINLPGYTAITTV